MPPGPKDRISASRPAKPDPHVAKANAYIEGVLSGTIPACEFVKQACQRQRNDLERFKDHPLYEWREDRAGRVCRFIECLPHVKGPKANAGEKFVLEPWQCFIFTTVYGWFRKDTGGRKFGRAYIEVPKGNGKSPMSSGVALYGLTSEGEQGAEVYSAATTRGQARIVFGDAQKMMRKAPKFRDKLGLVVNKLAIEQPHTNSKFEPISRDADASDGQNISVAVIDELHAHKTRDIYDIVEAGCAKRPSSLLWIITTAGKSTQGICYEVRADCLKILEGAVEDEGQFAIVFGVDEGDDPYALETWIKANPNWGISVQPDRFASKAAKAQRLASARNNFFTKSLNIWCNADLAWMSMEAWDACADPSLVDSDFAGETCMVGLDMGSVSDLTAKVKVFWRDLPKPEGEEKVRHYYVFVENYLPEASVEDGRNAQYEGWAEEGLIKATDGEVTDFARVESDILLDRDEHRLELVAYDPWQTEQMAQNLTAAGVKTVKVRPTKENLSAPMKEVEKLVRQKRLHHDGNACLRWQMTNVVSKEDDQGNIYPRKEKIENKIDAPVAIITVFNQAMTAEPGSNSGSYLTEEPLIVV